MKNFRFHEKSLSCVKYSKNTSAPKGLKNDIFEWNWYQKLYSSLLLFIEIFRININYGEFLLSNQMQTYISHLPKQVFTIEYLNGHILEGYCKKFTDSPGEIDKIIKLHNNAESVLFDSLC